MTERNTQRLCIAALRKAGWEVWVTSDKRRAVTPGIPDTYCVHRAKRERMWIEYKGPTGKPTEHQSAFIDAVRASGGRAEVVSSLDDLERILEGKGL